MKVHIPSPLCDYTGGRREVDADGATVAALLDDLDARYPGMRFRMIDEQDRIRPHIKVFVNAVQARRIDQPLARNDTVIIIAALSGG